MPLALITDCNGPSLSEEEASFLREAQPFGFILFQRHCESPEQVRALISQLQDCVAHDAPVFIDQEGGRVARLKPPHWETFPPAGDFAQLMARDPEAGIKACYLNARIIAATLQDCHITANCAPLADIPVPGAHDIIGDRALGKTPEGVVAMAEAQAQGLLDGGVLPVLKHIPGHGRARADSHEALPVVDTPLATLEATDFAPFRALKQLSFGMTAHIVYTALDDSLPATLSPRVISYIREQIGFTNLLMSDDLSMKALHGDLTDLARQTLAAGCDLVLHCNGSLAQRRKVAEGCAEMPPDRYALYEKARHAMPVQTVTDCAALRIERDARLAMLAA